MECVTYCYAERDCNTAVYQHDGDCYLIANFIDSLAITLAGEDNFSSSSQSEYIIEMNTRHPNGSGVGQDVSEPV